MFERYPTLRRAIVNLKGSDTAFSGLIWARRGGYLILREAQVLKPQLQPVRLDGEVLIPVSNIEFIQVVG